MNTDTTRVAERLFDVLVEEIRSERPELLDEGFTVAEIYQNLVPYRSHRDRIGVEMNGDYEHALLRLLAGEGEYLEIGSEAARRRFREELESVRPDTGVYRKFAAVEVRLNPERLPVPTAGPDSTSLSRETSSGPVASDAPAGGSGRAGSGASIPDTATDGAGGTEAPDADPPDRSRESSSTSAPAQDDTGRAASAAARPGDDGADATTGDATRRETCPWCRERLPDRPDLRFCPYCGSRADLTPCPECGTELEDDWLFCLACGAGVGD